MILYCLCHTHQSTTEDKLAQKSKRDFLELMKEHVGRVREKETSWIRCCYITVDSATTALQDGACTYKCISKQMHYNTPFSHNQYMKSLEFYENYNTLFCLEKNILFDNFISTQNHAWHITQSG
jgi:hypothetical protein